MKIYKEKNFWMAAFFVFLLDQVTKLWVLIKLPLDEEIVMNKYISLTRVYNEATVMMIHELPFGITISQFIFLWISICIFITIGIWWVIKQPALNGGGWTEEFAKTGLFLILGAAWGNAFDRIFRDGVVDFLQINYFKNIVPIINLADIMIYLGEFSLICAWFLIFINFITKKEIKTVTN